MQSKPRLTDFAATITSQWGEDGILTRIFNVIGIQSKHCMEFGAVDGIYLSNTAQLWRDKDWTAVLVEAAAEPYQALLHNTTGKKCHPIQGYVTAHGELTIDNILAGYSIPALDLISIDIDSDDYHVFASMKIRPRVVVVEYNPTIPFHMDLVQKPGTCLGASCRAMIRLAESMGYFLVAVTDTNCIFVLSEYKYRFEAYNCDPQSMFPTRYLNYVIGLSGGHYLFTQPPTYGNQGFATYDQTLDGTLWTPLKS